MGIPYLITYLRPYAELKSLAGQDVIVDGPGLCYHIHHRCLGRRTEARNSFEAAPSYGELGLATVEWLDGLRDNGAVVKKIYFDGFLPPAKIRTRLERLQRQTTQLIDYHNTHKTPGRTTPRSCETAPQSIFEGKHPRSALTSLPPPSFLVPAILEVLQSSKYYKDVTEVVPGEADLYCAKYISYHGGVVLTGDSDLLVHSLGTDGAVSFFGDVESSSEEQPGYLRTQIYQSAAIAERLGLPKTHGLLSLAFEMFMDHYGTFPKLVAQAAALKAVMASGSMFEDFCKEYTSGSEEPEVIGPSMRIFQSLDPRISEVVLQFPQLAKLAGQDAAAGNPSQDAPHVFLPFLLDCPNRTSAWEISTSVRQLAYGLLNLIVAKDQERFTVIEQRRQGKTPSTREWQLPRLSEISDACIATSDRFTELEDLHVPKTELWLAAMICQELEWSNSLDRASLSQIAMGQLSEFPDRDLDCSWDIVHFIAQMQGSYYSFRILKQILGVVMSSDEEPRLPNAVRQLSSRLECLPGFCEDPEINDMHSLYKRMKTTGLLQIAQRVVGIEEPPPIAADEGLTKPSRKKRKRERIADTNSLATNKTNSRNIFELLPQE
ncbi:hypothetical protein D0Z07_6126 [Hyphodiscus hymeniophilus]|uniref:Asteroid domain-containing protein n=1 Tax=Hyphodiscus hymeniophilus TaxID=353542 RepID=A0A9P6VFH4_9HELO|nr:hypothetical protein D0Z07_6126 [Hyphodiscus hymeniophilus]